MTGELRWEIVHSEAGHRIRLWSGSRIMLWSEHYVTKGNALRAIEEATQTAVVPMRVKKGARVEYRLAGAGRSIMFTDERELTDTDTIEGGLI